MFPRVHVFVCAHVQRIADLWILGYIFVCVSVCVYTSVFISMYIQKHTHAYEQKGVVFVKHTSHPQWHTHACSRTHTHTHTFTHTHTYTGVDLIKLAAPIVANNNDINNVVIGTCVFIFETLRNVFLCSTHCNLLQHWQWQRRDGSSLALQTLRDAFLFPILGNTLQHTATDWNTLQFTATHCTTYLCPRNSAQCSSIRSTPQWSAANWKRAKCCHTMHCTAIHYNALRHLSTLLYVST